MGSLKLAITGILIDTTDMGKCYKFGALLFSLDS